jgi:hypothetical protein
MKRALVLVALVLVVFNAQCFAACTLEPCAEPAKQQTQETPCHHQNPAPAEQHDSKACDHPQFVGEDGARIAAPELAVSGFELAVVFTLAPVPFAFVEERPLTNSPPPLQSPALSRAVLRV